MESSYCFSQLSLTYQVLSPPLSPPVSVSLKRKYPFLPSSHMEQYYQQAWSMSQPRPLLLPEQTPTRQQQPSKQNKHMCNYPNCGWSFKRHEHLKRHILVHTGERPHACTYPGCGKSFSRSDNFHAHYRTHIKKPQYQTPHDHQQEYVDCSIAPNYYVCEHDGCLRRFKRPEHLKRHTRIHTSERPFQCTFDGCHKTFARSDNLTQHMKTHERRGNGLFLNMERSADSSAHTYENRSCGSKLFIHRGPGQIGHSPDLPNAAASMHR